jgi:hypothetical protein
MVQYQPEHIPMSPAAPATQATPDDGSQTPRPRNASKGLITVAPYHGELDHLQPRPISIVPYPAFDADGPRFIHPMGSEPTYLQPATSPWQPERQQHPLSKQEHESESDDYEHMHDEQGRPTGASPQPPGFDAAYLHLPVAAPRFVQYSADIGIHASF